MNKLIALAFVAIVAFIASGSGVYAQLVVPVVSSCGTPPQTYNPGTSYPLTMDTTGKLCTSASGGGGGSTTITGPLGSQAASAAVAVTFGSADPCLSNLTVTQVPITLTTSNATQQITPSGLGSKKIYVCSGNILTAAANNVAISEGTSTNCGTGEVAIIGAGTHSAPTNGYGFGASAGINWQGFPGTQWQTLTGGDSICFTVSSAGPLSGFIRYVIQ